MKRQTEKPAERIMRFFTADLYTRFNSDDDAEADRANDEWEEALRRYEKHLDGVRSEMPPDLHELTRLCLHDATVLAFGRQKFAPLPCPDPFPFLSFSPAVAVLSLQQGERVLSIVYFLAEDVHEAAPDKGWPFSKRDKHVLYDEIDVIRRSPGVYAHRILFSDGQELELHFVSVICVPVPLRVEGGAEAKKQSA